MSARLHRVAHFLQSRPEIAQENVWPSLSLPSGSSVKVDIDATGQRERDDERRRHQEVRLDVLMHARFEIAIAGKDGSGHQIVFR